MTNKLPPLPEQSAFVDGAAIRWLGSPEMGADAYVETSLNKSDPAASRTPLFTLSQLQADRLAVWNAAIQAAAQAVPTNWLDSLLTGKEGIGQPPYDSQDIERLLRGVLSAIRLLEERN